MSLRRLVLDHSVRRFSAESSLANFLRNVTRRMIRFGLDNPSLFETLKPL
jgi:hypothetical protein